MRFLLLLPLLALTILSTACTLSIVKYPVDVTFQGHHGVGSWGASTQEAKYCSSTSNIIVNDNSFQVSSISSGASSQAESVSAYLDLEIDELHDFCYLTSWYKEAQNYGTNDLSVYFYSGDTNIPIYAPNLGSYSTTLSGGDSVCLRLSYFYNTLENKEYLKLYDGFEDHYVPLPLQWDKQNIVMRVYAGTWAYSWHTARSSITISEFKDSAIIPDLPDLPPLPDVQPENFLGTFFTFIINLCNSFIQWIIQILN